MSLKERSDVWTQASSNSVTTPGDLTGTYWPGMRVVLKQGTLKYFVILSVVYSSPNTTITLDGFGIYTLTSAPITAHIDSTEYAPKGFPYPDLATQIKAAIKAYTDTLYAVYGTGVTNGDSHDHVGGDGAQIDHGGLGGRSDDDHSIYALLAGRSGGQTLIGGTGSGENLTLQSTAHATKGKILFGTSAYDGANNRLGVCIAIPTRELDVNGAIIGGSTNLGSASIVDLKNTGKVLIGWNRSSSFRETALINNPVGGSAGSGGFYFSTYRDDGTETLVFKILGDGSVYVPQNCSALSFTDRTPAFTGQAIDALRKIAATKNGEIDHSTLPEFVQETSAKGTPERSIGGMVSVLVKGSQELITNLEAAVEERNQLISDLTKKLEEMNDRLTKLESR